MWDKGFIHTCHCQKKKHMFCSWINYIFAEFWLKRWWLPESRSEGKGFRRDLWSLLVKPKTRRKNFRCRKDRKNEFSHMSRKFMKWARDPGAFMPSIESCTVSMVDKFFFFFQHCTLHQPAVGRHSCGLYFKFGSDYGLWRTKVESLESSAGKTRKCRCGRR